MSAYSLPLRTPTSGAPIGALTVAGCRDDSCLPHADLLRRRRRHPCLLLRRAPVPERGRRHRRPQLADLRDRTERAGCPPDRAPNEVPTAPRHHAISFIVDDLDSTMAELREGRGSSAPAPTTTVTGSWRCSPCPAPTMCSSTSRGTRRRTRADDGSVRRPCARVHTMRASATITATTLLLIGLVGPMGTAAPAQAAVAAETDPSGDAGGAKRLDVTRVKVDNGGQEDRGPRDLRQADHRRSHREHRPAGEVGPAAGRDAQGQRRGHHAGAAGLLHRPRRTRAQTRSARTCGSDGTRTSPAW